MIGNYIKELIPHFGEELISFPLFEEGDYRPIVTTDFFIPMEDEWVEAFKSFSEAITERKWEGGEVEVEVDTYGIGRLSASKPYATTHHIIKTYQRGYMLDDGLIPSYDPIPLLKVQVEIRKEWDKIMNSSLK